MCAKTILKLRVSLDQFWLLRTSHRSCLTSDRHRLLCIPPQTFRGCPFPLPADCPTFDFGPISEETPPTPKALGLQVHCLRQYSHSRSLAAKNCIICRTHFNVSVQPIHSTELSVEGLCSLLAAQSGHGAEADVEELRTTEDCEGEGGNGTVYQSHVDARAHTQCSLPYTVLCMSTKLVSKTSDMEDVFLDLKSSFKAESADARDREQRLVNRISHLQKMLKEQSETEEKASELLKYLDGRTTFISRRQEIDSRKYLQY